MEALKMNNKQYNTYAGILVLALVCAVIIGISQGNDPNMIPVGFTGSPPKVEYLTKVNANTVRVTTSEDISEATLQVQLNRANNQLLIWESKRAEVQKRLDILK